MLYPAIILSLVHDPAVRGESVVCSHLPRAFRFITCMRASPSVLQYAFRELGPIEWRPWPVK
jgi:hypothetical protein